MLSYICPCIPRLLRSGGWSEDGGGPVDKLTPIPVPTEPPANEETKIASNLQLYGGCPDINKKLIFEEKQAANDVITEEPAAVQKRGSMGSQHSEISQPGRHSLQKKSSEDEAPIQRQRKGSEQTKIGEIRPDLYLKRDSILNHPAGSRKNSNLGQLHFRAFYDYKKSDFVVTLVEATLLTSTVAANTELYVTVQLCPTVDQKQRRSGVVKGQTPTFNEVFKFPATIDELSYRRLQFEIWNKSRVNNILIGTVNFELATVDVSAEVEVLAEVERKDELIDLGQIQVSVSYLAVAERLTVAVIEGKELKGAAVAATGNSDPYVKVNVNHDGKRLKKKNTSVKKNNSNPRWNEPLTFLVSPKLLKELSVQLIVMDRDANCLPIGEVNLGVKAPTKEGRAQWHEVCDGKSGTPYWHKVRPCGTIVTSD